MSVAENVFPRLASGPGRDRQLPPPYLQIVRPKVEIVRNQPIYATFDEIQSSYTNDPLVDSALRENSQYINLSQYKILEGEELALIQNIDVDSFEMLRRMGFVLFDPHTGVYLLMIGFDNDPILDLIELIQKEVNNFNNGINRAASQNGLVNGVLEGRIKDIAGYLRQNKYLKNEGLLAVTLNAIHSFNVRFAKEKAMINPPMPYIVPKTVELKVYTPDELENAVSLILEGTGPLDSLVGILNSTYPDEAERNAFLSEIIPVIGIQQRSRLLEFLEISEVFRWSTHSIDNLDKVDALIPVVNDQISTLNVLRKELFTPIADFLLRNPVWIRCWKEVINYALNRIVSISEGLGQKMSFEVSEKIRSFLLTEIASEFRLKITPTAPLTEA